jgi:hypothetical protein
MAYSACGAGVRGVSLALQNRPLTPRSALGSHALSQQQIQGLALCPLSTRRVEREWLRHDGEVPDEPMDRITKCLLAGIGAFVLVTVIAYLVSYDESSPVYAGTDNGPLFAVWLLGLGVGVGLLVVRQWVFGAAWLVGTVMSVVGTVVLAFTFLLA